MLVSCADLTQRRAPPPRAEGGGRVLAAGQEGAARGGAAQPRAASLPRHAAGHRGQGQEAQRGPRPLGRPQDGGRARGHRRQQVRRPRGEEVRAHQRRPAAARHQVPAVPGAREDPGGQWQRRRQLGRGAGRRRQHRHHQVRHEQPRLRAALHPHLPARPRGSLPPGWLPALPRPRRTRRPRGRPRCWPLRHTRRPPEPCSQPNRQESQISRYFTLT